MGAAYLYDVSKVVFVWANHRAQEFAEGDAITIAPVGVDRVSSQGTHGNVTVSEVPNNIYTVTLRLQQTSPSNSVLHDAHEATLASGSSTHPLTIEDLLGNTVVSAQQAWSIKRPELKYSKEAGDREWSFEMANPVFVMGSYVLA